MKEFVFEKREYQEAAVNETVQAFHSGCNSVLIESPVGSGKTIMGLMVASELVKKNPKIRVNWVASRQHILKQTQKVNSQYFHVPLNLVSVFDKEPPECDLCIIDEAHHEATNSCIRMYARCKNTCTLGLSATPQRTDRMKLSFKRTVHSCSIPMLIEDTVLVPFHSYKVPHYDPLSIAQIYASGKERFGMSLAFFRTIRECRQFAKFLNEQGISCEVVTGSSDKERQIDDFESGKIEVIANVGVLTEGFDLPELKSVFIRDSSKLPTIQMAGRGLRRSQNKTHCNFIQSSDSAFQVERIATPQEQFRLKKGHWLSCSGDTKQVEDEIKYYMKKLQDKKNNFKLEALPDVPREIEISLHDRSYRSKVLLSHRTYDSLNFIA